MSEKAGIFQRIKHAVFRLFIIIKFFIVTMIWPNEKMPMSLFKPTVRVSRSNNEDGINQRPGSMNYSCGPGG